MPTAQKAQCNHHQHPHHLHHHHHLRTNIPVVPFPRQSIPCLGLFSSTWSLFISARVSMGGRPEFSARARGMLSRASPKALMAYCSKVETWRRDGRSFHLFYGRYFERLLWTRRHKLSSLKITKRHRQKIIIQINKFVRPCRQPSWRPMSRQSRRLRLHRRPCCPWPGSWWRRLHHGCFSWLLRWSGKSTKQWKNILRKKKAVN